MAKHHDVAESAIVGIPHAVKVSPIYDRRSHGAKGEAIYAFVILNEGVEASDVKGVRVTQS